MENEKTFMIVDSVKDVNGKELKVGDIVTATVKYKIVDMQDGKVILAQKIYDVPVTAFTFYSR